MEKVQINDEEISIKNWFRSRIFYTCPSGWKYYTNDFATYMARANCQRTVIDFCGLFVLNNLLCD